jgi:RimJ/RimL family protein N-acetyltransferase
MTEGRDIAWLQDTPDQNAWGVWGVRYRDVIVLDPEGTVVGVVNLTDFDLGEAATEEQLREYVDDGLSRL